MDDNKQKALQDCDLVRLKKTTERKHIMKLGEGSVYPEIEAVSTGSLTLDYSAWNRWPAQRQS